MDSPRLSNHSEYCLAMSECWLHSLPSASSCPISIVTTEMRKAIFRRDYRGAQGGCGVCIGEFRQTGSLYDVYNRDSKLNGVYYCAFWLPAIGLLRGREHSTASHRRQDSHKTTPQIYALPFSLNTRKSLQNLRFIRWLKSLKVSHLLPYPLTIGFDPVAEDRSERGHALGHAVVWRPLRDEVLFDEDDYSSSNATERLTATLPAIVPVRRYTSRHSEADVSSAYGDTHLILGLSNFPTSSLVTPATMLWSAGAPNACPYCGNYLVNGRCLNPRHG